MRFVFAVCVVICAATGDDGLWPFPDGLTGSFAYPLPLLPPSHRKRKRSLLQTNHLFSTDNPKKKFTGKQKKQQPITKQKNNNDTGTTQRNDTQTKTTKTKKAAGGGIDGSGIGLSLIHI